MHHAHRVRVPQRFQDLPHDAHRPRRRHGRLTHLLVQGAASHVFHDDIRALTPHAEVEDADAVTVLQPADGARLTVETRHRGLGADRGLLEKLDGYRLAELDPLGAIDHAHAAFAELFDELPALVDDLADEAIGWLVRH